MRATSPHRGEVEAESSARLRSVGLLAGVARERAEETRRHQARSRHRPAEFFVRSIDARG